MWKHQRGPPGNWARQKASFVSLLFVKYCMLAYHIALFFFRHSLPNSAVVLDMSSGLQKIVKKGSSRGGKCQAASSSLQSKQAAGKPQSLLQWQKEVRGVRRKWSSSLTETALHLNLDWHHIRADAALFRCVWPAESNTCCTYLLSCVVDQKNSL